MLSLLGFSGPVRLLVFLVAVFPLSSHVLMWPLGFWLPGLLLGFLVQCSVQYSRSFLQNWGPEYAGHETGVKPGFIERALRSVIGWRVVSCLGSLDQAWPLVQLMFSVEDLFLERTKQIFDE